MRQQKKPRVARVCKQCSTEFEAVISQVRAGNAQFCSRDCQNESRRIPLETRFYQRVITHDNSCWEWIGPKDPNGYGRIRINTRRSAPASRASWLIHKGSIPDGLWVLHHCDNPECTNPDHLFLGTARDNTRDMMSKGRHR